MIKLVNSETQNELLDIMGAEELRDLMREASQEFQEQAPPLQLAMQSSDWLQVRVLAHKIKGLIGSLGYERLYSTLNDLEQQLLAVPPRLPDLSQITAIGQTLADTRFALEKFEV